MKQKKRLSVAAACVASFVVTLLLQAAFPTEDLMMALLVEAACSVVVVFFLLLSSAERRQVLQREGFGAKGNLTIAALVLVVGAGAIEGIPSWVALAGDARAATLLNDIPLISLVVLLCLATGVYEEGLFRGLFVPALKERFEEKAHARIWVCAIAGIVFAALHVRWAGPLPVSPETWIWATVKPLQAFAFSWCLCLVVLRGGGVWSCMAAHGLFDVFALGALFTATQSAAVPGFTHGMTGAVALLASVVVLVVAIVLLERGTLKRLDANLKEGT